ncbi:MAG TPA: endolytic transglycosylase MltG [Bacillus sp. (in: firmicutes)]|uniref:endolytic transglycosylase MltG n=1 Tax=Bacillus litorisediminis TaxID=2922713 RepID=UPI001FAE0A5F|nr:endolytic transglycosylase MltG [Bacillus litorisediminis]HWO74747.1 endolytic transglycosylase MltG [Bacillus sp. (in: firmicutes)]
MKSTDEQENNKEIIQEKWLERQREAKTIRRIVFIITTTLFLFVGGAVLGGILYVSSALKPADPESREYKDIEIPIGSSVTAIANILEDGDIIKDATIFKYYIKFKNESGFQAGQYELSPSMTFDQIIQSLKTGKVVREVDFKVTIPEGLWLEDIAGRIAKQTGQTKEEVFTTLNDPAFIEQMMNEFPFILTEDILNESIKYPLEGYLFPATYSYYEDEHTVEAIVRKMLSKTSDVLMEYQGLLEERQLTVHQALTLASLIEEEATESVDRHLISSVFYNRMEIGMPLQTDPTVLYAKGEHQERTMYEDLEIDSPYNTYTNAGLPPGPIANPGVSSIEAALNPEETNYLYFLATPEGQVLFSETLEEHNVKKAEHISSET